MKEHTTSIPKISYGKDNQEIRTIQEFFYYDFVVGDHFTFKHKTERRFKLLAKDDHQAILNYSNLLSKKHKDKTTISSLDGILWMNKFRAVKARGRTVLQFEFIRKIPRSELLKII